MPTARPMPAGKRLFLGRVFPWAVLLIGGLFVYLGVANVLLVFVMPKVFGPAPG